MSDDLTTLHDLLNAVRKDAVRFRASLGLEELLEASLPLFAKLPALEKRIAEAVTQAEVAEGNAAVRVQRADERAAEAEARAREAQARAAEVVADAEQRMETANAGAAEAEARLTAARSAHEALLLSLGART